MDRWMGKVAVVTGASSGIGESISTTLVDHGLVVIGLARRTDKLQVLGKRLASAKGTFHSMLCDVTKEEQILEVFKFAKSLGGVDILINNAGVTFRETIIDGTTKNFETVLDVNVLAVAICTREASKSMRERNAEGHIINVNSIAGHTVRKDHVALSLYNASKYAMTAMSKVVRNELDAVKASVKVTNLSPGLVKTEMPLSLAKNDAAIFQLLPHLRCQDISDAVIYILGTPPHVQVTELTLVGSLREMTA